MPQTSVCGIRPTPRGGRGHILTRTNTLLMRDQTVHRHTLQCDRGLATIQGNQRASVVSGVDVAILHEVGQRMSFHSQSVLSRHEVRDDRMIMAADREQVGIGAARHRVVATGATRECIRTELAAALHHDIAAARHELVRVLAADQGRIAAHRHQLVRIPVRVNDIQLASGNRGSAKSPVNRCGALLPNRVAAEAKVDRIVTTETVFVDRAVSDQGDGIRSTPNADAGIGVIRDRIVAGSSLNQTITVDIDGIVTASGEHGAVPVHRDIVIPTRY